MTGSLPRLYSVAPDHILDWANQLVNELELQLDSANRPAGTGWAGTNYTPTRSVDASSATLADTRTVLATLIEVLKARGFLSK